MAAICATDCTEAKLAADGKAGSVKTASSSVDTAMAMTKANLRSEVRSSSTISPSVSSPMKVAWRLTLSRCSNRSSACATLLE
ncbi:MAG: hypothetical protein V9H69_17990 [Anaerolineae bacterium]